MSAAGGGWGGREGVPSDWIPAERHSKTGRLPVAKYSFVGSCLLSIGIKADKNIKHLLSISISWNQHPRHLLDARVRTCRRCPPDLSRSHSQQPARVQGHIPIHNCGNGINETTSGSAFIRNQSVTVRTVNWCHQRSTPGCTCQEKLRYMKLRQSNCWNGLWRQICTTDDGFF